MAVAPRPWRRSALVGRALPGRRRESPAEVWFDGVDALFVFVAEDEDRAEAGMVDPNAESRAGPRDDADPFASVKGTGARFPSAVCLLMPEGSNDLTACVAVLREGPAVVARPLVRAGYAPDTPRASSNENLNSLCRCASALAPP